MRDRRIHGDEQIERVQAGGGVGEVAERSAQPFNRCTHRRFSRLCANLQRMANL